MNKLYAVDFIHYGGARDAFIESYEVARETKGQYQIRTGYDMSRNSLVNKDTVDNVHSKYHTTAAGAITQAIAHRQAIIDERRKEIDMLLADIAAVERLK